MKNARIVLVALLALLASRALPAQVPAAAQPAAPTQPESSALKERWREGDAPAGQALPPGSSSAEGAAPSAQPGQPFDAEAATEAYLARMTHEARAKSDAYYEGGYWLQVWGFLWSAGVLLLLLFTRTSERMRALAERISSWRGVQALLYGAQFLVVTTLLGLPLSVYSGFFREQKYGLMNQTLGAWAGEQAIGLAVSAIFGGLGIMLLYAVLRRVRRMWWVWGTGIAVGLMAVGALVAPVYISPLFNDYKPMDAGALREDILSLARANGIPAHEVYQFDASKQTKRVSANVSGMAGTMRISLNDNLLTRCSPASVRAVMGHEMGHYALNHVYKGLIGFGLIIAGGFACSAWGFERLRRRFGGRWGVRDIADPAGLPVIMLLLSAWFFVMTPVTNTLIRVNESEADIYGLNAAREPDGFAEAALMLSEYRKMRPSKWEEMMFFDHPSGETRIRMAMRWKAENMAKAAN